MSMHVNQEMSIKYLEPLHIIHGTHYALSGIGVESPDTDCFKDNNNKKVTFTVKIIQLWLSMKELKNVIIRRLNIKYYKTPQEK